MAPCSLCPSANPSRAILRRPKTLQPVCKECFFKVFETEIHNTIIGFGQAEGSSSGKGKGKELFKRGERVAIGASGGKGQFVDFFFGVDEMWSHGQGGSGEAGTIDFYLIRLHQCLTEAQGYSSRVLINSCHSQTRRS